MFEEVILDYFARLVDDGVQHVELRGIESVYADDTLSMYSPSEMLNLWRQLLQSEKLCPAKLTVTEFNAQSEVQLTMKFIVQAIRSRPARPVYEIMLETVELMRNYTEVVGFDLVDEEDRYFAPKML